MSIQVIAYYAGWGMLAILALFTLWLIVFLVQHNMYNSKDDRIPKLQELKTETTGIKNEIQFDDSIEDIQRMTFNNDTKKSNSGENPFKKRSEIRPDMQKKEFFND